MRQSIRGYADGIVDQISSGDASRLTDEMSAVWLVVESSEDLQGALNDPFVAAPVRRSLLDDLFGSRVGRETMRLLNFVIEADRASEMVEDIAWLAGRFGREGGEEGGVLGHRAAEERVEGYATALLESVSGRDELGNLEDELFRFRQIVAGSEELREVLSSREVPAEARRNLVADLLQGRATATTTGLALYPLRVGRPRDYLGLIESVIARISLETNRRLADVHSAVELDENQRTHLAAAMSRAVGRDVEVRVTVDPSVIGGFLAVIGDTVIDGSARHQLEILRERLTAAETH
jgi:F-type H+-transporting ATPase subunit delta